MSKSLHHEKLPNYLRMHRKRAGFSQEEIAFLLGIRTGAPISRYERLTRNPTLAVVFALQIIFQVPAEHIFSGLLQQVKERLGRQAALLFKKTLRNAPETFPVKLRVLKRIAESDAFHNGK